MNEKWTTDNIPNQTNRIVIVTGANSGIGYETAKALAEKGATVIMACRNLDKANSAQQTIQEQVSHAQLDIIQLDLADQASVHQFVVEFKAKYSRLDLLINNAGVMAPPYTQTKDGFELQFAANHLGHFTLTGLLLDYLMRTPLARVVNVSSNAHKFGKINFDDLQSADSYAPWAAYGQSKLANMLFTVALNTHFQTHNLDVIATAAHPGWTTTGLQKGAAIKLVTRFVAQQTPMGALPTLYAAVAAEAQANDYYGPSGFMEMRGYPQKVKPSDSAPNTQIADRLWQVSEELTGVKYQWKVANSSEDDQVPEMSL